MIEIALNGGRPGAPATVEEVANDVAICAAAGATVFHIHPRGPGGIESLQPEDVDRLVATIRARTPRVSVGLTTGAWILPHLRRRLDAIEQWRELPDFASVNFDEAGCELVAGLVVGRGVGVEAGVTDQASAQRFLAASVPVLRVLIELKEQNLDDALRALESVVVTLGDHPAPKLLHGHGDMVWELFDEAARRGYDSRIGLEDVDVPTTNLELFTRALARLKESS